jgi:thiol-disulfide isomerase/thioredoxin
VDRLLVLLAVLVVTGAVAAWWRARDGRVIGASLPVGTPAASPWEGLPVDAADVVAAITPSTPLTFVEFTAPDCVPCARTRELLDDVTADRPDVSVVAVDVADGLDLARAHRIMRAPTTLLITADGHLLGRVSGVPRADELDELLARTATGSRAA